MKLNLKINLDKLNLNLKKNLISFLFYFIYLKSQ